MRIIKKANIEETEHTCTSCSSIFAYTEYDTVDNSWSDMGVSCKEIDVKCPVCNSPNSLVFEII